MTNQAEVQVLVSGAGNAVWRLQKDDIASIIVSTKALVEEQEYDEVFEKAKQDLEIHDVDVTIDIFLDIHGFTDKTSSAFANTVTTYAPLNATLPELDPADEIYVLQLSDFLEHLENKYSITLTGTEQAALQSLIIEKFSVDCWEEYVATFIDINGYHSPKEDRL